MKPMLISLLCLYSYILSAAEYHVDHSGTRDFTTIQEACDVAVAGDTVTIHAGVYNEWAQPKNSGTESQPITYRANPGDTVWIDGENTRISCFGPNPDVNYNKIHHIVLEDLGFRNATSVSQANFWVAPDGTQQGMVTPAAGHSWTLRRCEFTGSGNVGFDAGALGGKYPGYSPNNSGRKFGFHLIENCYFHDNHGCHICGHRAFFVRIIGNRLETSGPGDTHENGAIKLHRCAQGLIAFNIFEGNQKRAIWLDNGNQGVRVRGNIFMPRTAVASNGIYSEANIGPLYYDHNIFLGTGWQTNQTGTGVSVNNLVVNTARLGHDGTARPNRDIFFPGDWHYDPAKDNYNMTGEWGQWFNNLYFNPDPNEHQWSRAIAGSSNFGSLKHFWALAYTSSAAEVDRAEQSVFVDFDPNPTWEKNGDTFTIRFQIDNALSQPDNAIVDETVCWAAYDNKMPDTNEVCPRMDTDINDKQWTDANIVSGPFSDLKPGLNEYTFVFGPNRGLDTNNINPVISQVEANPDTVTGVTAVLSANASDADNDPLTFTWSVTSNPAGASSPSFSVNGDGSSSTTVTFAQAGDYTFSVTVSDGRGGSASELVDVTVSQTASDLTVE